MISFSKLKSIVTGVRKDSPTSSQVHVPSTGDEDRICLKMRDGGEVHVDKHDIENLRNLHEALDQFFREEAAEKARLKKDFPTGDKEAKPAAPKPTPPIATPFDHDDKDSNPGMYPDINNDEYELIKSAYGAVEQDSNDDMYLHDMQRLVEGVDWEVNHNMVTDQPTAQELAIENLNHDPDYYRKLRMGEDSTDDQLAKDTRETEQDPEEGHQGLKIDLGPGVDRQDGHIGFDIYPYDYGTIIHDLNMGIPLPDQSCEAVHMANALHEIEDPEQMISEVHRVLMPGGVFHYEGPDDLAGNEGWSDAYPGLVLTDHESNSEGDVEKTDGPIFRQQFTRVAVPDAATANDAQPRVGLASLDAGPADALLDMDAVGYDWSDASTSGRGNRLHGYASQGAPIGKRDTAGRGRGGGAGGAGKSEASKKASHQQVAPRTEQVSSIIQKALSSQIPIVKADAEKQIVYGVVLEPDTTDSQNDFMTADEIEKTAHEYMATSRVIGSQHSKPAQAVPVESYIAPMDMDLDGQYGPQVVKKGSWVLAVKVLDPEEWAKVKSGEYTGFSVGGTGQRDEVA